jgi:hypothetical protein
MVKGEKRRGKRKLYNKKREKEKKEEAQGENKGK